MNTIRVAHAGRRQRVLPTPAGGSGCCPHWWATAGAAHAGGRQRVLPTAAGGARKFGHAQDRACMKNLNLL